MTAISCHCLPCRLPLDKHGVTIVPGCRVLHPTGQVGIVKVVGWALHCVIDGMECVNWRTMICGSYQPTDYEVIQ
jgi:hypothetical protein